MHHLKQLWIDTTSSLWFVPLTMVAVAIVLAVGLTWTDFKIGNGWTAQTPLFGVGASGARGMLSAIAGSMMTVASLTFSLTISTLATASSQYTSRLVRNFMRDGVNQFVLGYFVGLFAYCLVVLRTIRSGHETDFVPAIAVTGGLVLALVSIGVLIYFIHHIAESIQAATILEKVTNETTDALDVLFPGNVGDSATENEVDPPNMLTRTDVTWHPIAACKCGYMQSVDAQTLVKIAAEHNTLIRMVVDVGGFITPAGALCEIAMPDAPDDELEKRLRGNFSVGSARTIEQDAAFGMRQIVDIALKALSPGINDTTTGVMCVEHLAVILESLAVRPIPSNYRAEDGVVRLVATGRSFGTFTALCLNQIRQNASNNPAVMVALLSAVNAAGRLTTDPGRRANLAHHARLIGMVADDSLKGDDDRQPVSDLAERILSELRATPPETV